MLFYKLKWICMGGQLDIRALIMSLVGCVGRVCRGLVSCVGRVCRGLVSCVGRDFRGLVSSEGRVSRWVGGTVNWHWTTSRGGGTK